MLAIPNVLFCGRPHSFTGSAHVFIFQADTDILTRAVTAWHERWGRHESGIHAFGIVSLCLARSSITDWVLAGECGCASAGGVVSLRHSHVAASALDSSNQVAGGGAAVVRDGRREGAADCWTAFWLAASDCICGSVSWSADCRCTRSIPRPAFTHKVSVECG